MSRREIIEDWLRAGLAAVDPECLTADALADRTGPLTVLAIGKAAATMCRGAAEAVGEINGLCVTSHQESVPDGVELMIGDHPYPSDASLAAGRRALEIAPRADVALISGGGSSLCEIPAEGLTIDFVAEVNRDLLESGADIADINVVRSHLSLIKGGGLGPIPTFLISDVAGSGPEFVSSGPTIASPPDPDRAISILRRVGVSVDSDLEEIVRRHQVGSTEPTSVEVIGDGHTAARAVAAAVAPDLPARVRTGWLEGGYRENLVEFIRPSEPGVTVAAGEPSVPAEDGGRGGRNTHTALTAAEMIAGTDLWFAALATDGVDGSSQSAGAIVDGTTIERGGDPSQSLAKYDSATYLERIGDLIETGPTGTNVADLWLIFRPMAGSDLY